MKGAERELLWSEPDDLTFVRQRIIVIADVAHPNLVSSQLHCQIVRLRDFQTR